jgi:glycolate oxidase FAD binding subunit
VTGLDVAGAPRWAAGAEVVSPAGLAEARDAVTAPGSLLFRGSGSKLDWGAVPERVDRVVSTARLDRLVSHDPGDLTATVQAGMPLAVLQAALARSGQWLALDPPRAGTRAGATIGGLLASGDAGPRRQRYGTLRDLVIGTTAVLSGGAVSRSGGKVIKNVAGYDLARLLCGSLGTLGLVVEVSVRLHPLPATSATVSATARAAAAGGIALALLAAPLEPAAIDWVGPPGGEGTLLVRFQGRADAVAAQAGAALALLGRGGAGRAERLDGDAEDDAWNRAAERIAPTVVRGVTLPSELGEAARALDAAAGAAGVHAALHSHAGLGLHDALLSGGDAPAHARVVEAWREALVALGGSAVVRDGATRLAGIVDVWGPPPPSLASMRAVKRALDPQRRCAPGRFVGGL